MRTALVALSALALTGCAGATTSLQGPPVDLHTLATPHAPAVAPVLLPPPVSVPPGRWRVWVPPQTNEHGEQVDGHFTTISLAPPVAPAVVTPTKPMPRTPKHMPAPAVKAVSPPAPVVQVVPAAPPALPTIPNGVLPSGMRAKGTNRVPLMQGLPQGVPPVPGLVPPQQLPGVPQ